MFSYIPTNKSLSEFISSGDFLYNFRNKISYKNTEERRLKLMDKNVKKYIQQTGIEKIPLALNDSGTNSNERIVDERRTEVH